MVNSFLLFALVFTFADITTSSEKYKKWKFESCDLDNADSCGRVVFLYGNREVHLPDNTRDMVPHCNEEKSAVRCVYDWGRNCLKAFPRQALFLLMSGAAKNIKERCAPKGTAWYLNHTKCVFESANDLHDCMDELTNNINSILRVANKQDWLPTACCFVDQWKNCFNKKAKKHCDEKGMEFLRWGSDSYVSHLTDIACSGKLKYQGSRCQALFKQIPEGPKNLTEKKPKSILLPMYKLLTGYADWEKTEVPEFKPAE